MPGVRHVAVDRAAARHRRHHQAVAQLEIAQPVGLEQRLRFGGGRLHGDGILQRGGLLDAHDIAPDWNGRGPRLVVLTGNTT
jgi:hypothetical protein